MTEHTGRLPAADPNWYHDAIIYEVHVRAFQDSNGDGIGDFPGLTARLDYIQQLGVTTIWLLPFYPSPLRDDGYDIADYYEVHPSYGTLADFQHFLEEAHRRDMRVITELVINHTSDQHPWFQRARRGAADSPERDFYVWSDTTDRYNDVRIIFHDTETSNWAWDPVAGAYYWHRFFSHQPDLNYDNPAVFDAVIDVLKFWLDMGVDGVRLDAIPYLFEREGTNGENLPETHAALKRIRAYVDEHYADRMILAEANQWPEDTVEYFGDGDECHMSFHFPLMPRLYLALHTGERLPIVDILEQTPEIPPSAQWATFLRNHDELTLEMVTDEERELMWQAYAPDRRARLNMGIRRRLAPLLGNDRRRIELMFALLLSLTGTPVLYYGDELGMGDNIFLADRDGVRTPMQWSNDRNAGFSSANPQSLYLPVIIDPEYHYETVNAEAQHANPNSLLWWIRNMLHLRRRHPVFGRGTFRWLEPFNPHVLAFLREYEEETILVVANLTADAQYVELDLGEFNGARPIELLGATDFPHIGELPYLLTLGPHGFFWFELTRAAADEADVHGPIELHERFDTLVGSEHPVVRAIERRLAGYHWYRAEGNGHCQLRDAIPIGEPDSTPQYWIAVLDRTGDAGGHQGTYAVPIGIAMGAEAADHATAAVIAEIVGHESTGMLFDATGDGRYYAALVDALSEDTTTSIRGTMSAHSQPGSSLAERLAEPIEMPRLIARRDGTVRVSITDDLQLRTFTRIEPGTSPGVELRGYVAERAQADVVAPLDGWISYDSDEEFTIGLFEETPTDTPIANETFAALAAVAVRNDEIGDTGDQAMALAETVATVHETLAGYVEDPSINPVPLSELGQRGLYQTLRTTVQEGLAALARSDPGRQGRFRTVIDRRTEILEALEPVRTRTVHTLLSRVHGDMRLGVFSRRNGRYFIHDFAGDRTETAAQRRIKRSPLRDVAQLLRSIDYEAQRAALDAGGGVEMLRRAAAWSDTAQAAFKDRYLERMAGLGVIPDDPADVEMLLEVFAIARAIHELRWEVNHRPEWVPVAQLGLGRVLAWPIELQMDALTS